MVAAVAEIETGPVTTKTAEETQARMACKVAWMLVRGVAGYAVALVQAAVGIMTDRICNSSKCSSRHSISSSSNSSSNFKGNHTCLHTQVAMAWECIPNTWACLGLTHLGSFHVERMSRIRVFRHREVLGACPTCLLDILASGADPVAIWKSTGGWECTSSPPSVVGACPWLALLARCPGPPMAVTE